MSTRKKALVSKALTGKVSTKFVKKFNISLPADVVLTNTQVDIRGSSIRFVGSNNTVLATFNSRSAKFTVHRKLIIGNTDVMAKLNDLEERIQQLES